MANVESMVRKAHFYIAPWYAEGVTKAPVMTREEEKAWYEKFEADFGSLQRNREKLSVETLQTKYAKGYNRLIADLKAGVDTLLEYHIQMFVVKSLPLHPLDRDGLERFVKRTNGIIREETAPGRLLEQAKAALIDGLDMEKCWELVYRIYERIEGEAFYPYWTKHTFKRNGRLWNDIYSRWWQPKRENKSGYWAEPDGSAYSYDFPPKEAAPWEKAVCPEMPCCKGCGAPILWYRTADGKPMPCNPVPITYWKQTEGRKKVLTLGGEIVSCEYDGDGDGETGYIPHWATCPNAKDFRKN